MPAAPMPWSARNTILDVCQLECSIEKHRFLQLGKGRRSSAGPREGNENEDAQEQHGLAAKDVAQLGPYDQKT